LACEVRDRTFHAYSGDDEPLDTADVRFWITNPNGTAHYYSSNSSSQVLYDVGNGSYRVRFSFQGTKVCDNSTTSLTTESDVWLTSNVYTRAFFICDNAWTPLFNTPTRIYITFPNGTTYYPSNASSYAISDLANGTYRFQTIYEQTKVGDNSSIWTNEALVYYTTKVYDRTFHAYSGDGEPLDTSQVRFLITCPNSTSVYADSNSSALTYHLMPNGTYRIRYSFQGTQVCDNSTSALTTETNAWYKSNVYT